MALRRSEAPVVSLSTRQPIARSTSDGRLPPIWKADTKQAPSVWSVWLVDPGLVDPFKDNPRRFFDDRELRELAEALESNGQKQAVPVRWKGGGRFEIADGERRWRGTKLKSRLLTIVVVPQVDDAQKFEDALAANANRKDFSALEMVKAIGRLRYNHKRSVAYISTLTGLSGGSVSQHLKIFDETTAAVKALMHPSRGKRRLKFTVALELTKLFSEPDRQFTVAQHIVEHKLTGVQAQHAIARSVHNLGVRQVETSQSPSKDYQSLRSFVISMDARLIRFLNIGQVGYAKAFESAGAKEARWVESKIANIIDGLTEVQKQVRRVAQKA